MVIRMIKGIGIDMIELQRIKQLVKRKERFVERILTTSEKKKYETLTGHRKIEYLAGRFAAKEAFAKAKGTGIGQSLSFLDIETANHMTGQPIIVRPVDGCLVHLSISHSREYAIAQVIIEKE